MTVSMSRTHTKNLKTLGQLLGRRTTWFVSIDTSRGVKNQTFKSWPDKEGVGILTSYLKLKCGLLRRTFCRINIDCSSKDKKVFLGETVFFIFELKFEPKSVSQKHKSFGPPILKLFQSLQIFCVSSWGWDGHLDTLTSILAQSVR